MAGPPDNRPFVPPPQRADVKRGSRSRGGQSAAEGGRAKRWPERDREPLFHSPAPRWSKTVLPPHVSGRQIRPMNDPSGPIESIRRL